MSILNDMGNTPLVKLKNPFGDNYAQVYLKMEEFNPGGSTKNHVLLYRWLRMQKLLVS